MYQPTLRQIILASFISFFLIICAPEVAFAQHGGGHGGGGSSGGSHSGGPSGGGGSFHGGPSEGGFHGGSPYGGSSYGGPRGGPASGSERYGSMGRESAARGVGGQRGSSLGRADTSPGWHSLGASNRMGGPNGMHSAIADGQWHSFGNTHAALATGTRFGGNAAFIHGGWGAGGWGGWRGGWGYRGYGFGWGCWGCGWGYGFGWGIGWNPYWAVYPYPYWDSLWWGDPYGYFGWPGYVYPYADDAQ